MVLEGLLCKHRLAYKKIHCIPLEAVSIPLRFAGFDNAFGRAEVSEALQISEIANCDLTDDGMEGPVLKPVANLYLALVQLRVLRVTPPENFGSALSRRRHPPKETLLGITVIIPLP
jgi:hypothetical protein